jgi:hypothetical protein
MYITGKSIDRRTFLQGTGAALALPLLDAMTPAFATGAARPTRMAFFQVPNGIMNLQNDNVDPAKKKSCGNGEEPCLFREQSCGWAGRFATEASWQDRTACFLATSTRACWPRRFSFRIGNTQAIFFTRFVGYWQHHLKYAVKGPK